MSKIRLSHSRTLTMRFATLTLETCSYGLNDTATLYVKTEKFGFLPVVSMEISPSGHTIMRPSSEVTVRVVEGSESTEGANVSRVPL